MLGNILRQNQIFFNQKLDSETITDLFSFNKSLNQVKHSVIGISQTSFNDPNTIFLFDLKDLQSFSLLESDQQLNIKLGQNIITNIKNKL